MFFGDNVGHTIRRLTHKTKYNILYRPHGSCFDHFIRHLVSKFTDRFFISNKVSVDDAVNLIDGRSVEEVINTRLCAPYNFQICSNVNKNLDATLTNHIPLVYLVHTKEDLIDLDNNLLGRYPYVVLIANKSLWDLSKKLTIDPDRIFYIPFSVQDSLESKIDRTTAPSVDVSILLGGQNVDQVNSISKRLQAANLTTKILSNNFTSRSLSEAFATTKVMVELNPVNIYNTIYSINCGTHALIYNKEHTNNTEYIYRSFDEMVEKIKYFIDQKPELPTMGFVETGASDIEAVLTNINNRGLII